MVNSTVEVRPQGVRLPGNEKASIAPSYSAEKTTNNPHSVSVNNASLPKGAYSVSKALLAKGQQQVTVVQIAQQAIHKVGSELQSMKRVLTQTLHSPGDPSLSNSNQAKQLIQQQTNIKSWLQSAVSDGVRVLDSQLRIQVDREPERSFMIPGLDLTRQRHQDEQIRLDFPNSGTALITLNSQRDDQQLASQIDRSLVPLGIRASLGSNGELLFKAKESDFSQMSQQVMVTGQGHRYPAGQPNMIKLKPEPEGIEDLSINLSSRDNIRRTISKVTQGLRQVQQSIDEIKVYQTEFARQVTQIKAQINVDDIAAIEGKISSLTSAVNTNFTATYQAVSAQANVHRHTVVALLK
ncbi:flagellin [Photobacterium sp.]|uniref:flagellin n=1 Tax=Photobacterium sp. TaxID=660 RepID=UPI00299CF8F9|nr:flagellin [Photobacterium sp.]MDX1301089.1 flagellin [Photobacterium sp.]